MARPVTRADAQPDSPPADDAPDEPGPAGGPPVPTATTIGWGHGDVPGAPARWPHLGTRRALHVLVVLLILVGGSAAAWINHRETQREADRRQQILADQTGNVAVAIVQQVLAGISGANGLVEGGGDVDDTAFRSFAEGLMAESPMQSVSYVAVVDADERGAFEDEWDTRIVDARTGDAAGEPDEYYAVRSVVGSGPDTATVGVDLGADPVRGPASRAARDAGRPLVSRPVSARSTDDQVVFVVQPVYRVDTPRDATVAERREGHIGFVTTALVGDNLLDTLLTQLDERIDVTVRDGGVQIASTEDPPTQASSVERKVGDRTWTITVEQRDEPPALAPWLILAATLAVAAAVGGLARRTSRDQRHTARYAQQIDRMAALARSLAGATGVDRVADIIAEDVPHIVGAASVTFGVVDREAGRVERYFRPGAVGTRFVERYESVDLDSEIPVAHCARTGVPVLMETLDDWRAHTTADVADDVERAGLGATACWPIRNAEGTVIATLSTSWGRDVTIDEITRASLATIAELVEHTLARARLTDARVADARLDAELATLTSGLSGLDTADEVMTFLTDHLARPLAAVHATVGVIEPGGILRRHTGRDAEGTEQFAIDELDAQRPLCEAARTGTTIVVPDRETACRRWPEVADEWREGGFAAAAVIAVNDRRGTPIGSLGVAWDRAVDFDDDLMVRLTTLADIVAQSLQRAGLSDAVRQDAVRGNRLAALAEAASAAGTTEEMAQVLAERAAAVVDGVGGFVGLVTPDRRALHVIHHSAFDPEIVDDFIVQPLDRPELPQVQAFTTGETLLFTDLDEVAARFPEVRDAVAAVGLDGMAIMPMATERGTPFGTLGIGWSGPQHFDERLRATLRTMTDLCATGLTRAWLTDRTNQRTSALSRLARHLSVARTFDEVSAAITEHAPAALDAQAVVVGLVDGNRFRLRVPSDRFGGLAVPYTDLPLDDDFPALEALRRNELVTFISPEERPSHPVVAQLGRVGIRAGACAPLTAADGDVLGVLSVLWARAPDFDDEQEDRIRTVADLAEQTAERARLFDAEHRVTQDLQRRVLSRIPAIAGIEAIARYQPATVGMGMGGDWYDGIALGDDRLCIVLGDVTGHGLGAVATMTQIRASVRTLVASGAALPEVIARTSAQMREEATGYATICIATVDARQGTLTYAVAGHPPPVLRTPDGHVELLAAARHPILGVPVPDLRTAATVTFPPGATFVTYTDGLIERPGTPIDTSIDELAAQVASAPASGAAPLADHLLSLHQRAADHADDVALAVVHHLG